MRIFIIYICFIATAAWASECEFESCDKHPHGKPVNILKVNDYGVSEVDSNAIKSLFSHPELKNRKAVIVTIVGDFRKGKSFFLNYCLRYLYENVSYHNFQSNYQDSQKKISKFSVQIDKFYRKSFKKFKWLDWWSKWTSYGIFMEIRSRSRHNWSYFLVRHLSSYFKNYWWKIGYLRSWLSRSLRQPNNSSWQFENFCFKHFIVIGSNS